MFIRAFNIICARYIGQNIYMCIFRYPQCCPHEHCHLRHGGRSLMGDQVWMEAGVLASPAFYCSCHGYTMS